VWALYVDYPRMGPDGAGVSDNALYVLSTSGVASTHRSLMAAPTHTVNTALVFQARVRGSTAKTVPRVTFSAQGVSTSHVKRTRLEATEDGRPSTTMGIEVLLTVVASAMREALVTFADLTGAARVAAAAASSSTVCCLGPARACSWVLCPLSAKEGVDMVRAMYTRTDIAYPSSIAKALRVVALCPSGADVSRADAKRMLRAYLSVYAFATREKVVHPVTPAVEGSVHVDCVNAMLVDLVRPYGASAFPCGPYADLFATTRPVREGVACLDASACDWEMPPTVADIRPCVPTWLNKPPTLASGPQGENEVTGSTWTSTGVASTHRSFVTAVNLVAGCSSTVPWPANVSDVKLCMQTSVPLGRHPIEQWGLASGAVPTVLLRVNKQAIASVLDEDAPKLTILVHRVKTIDGSAKYACRVFTNLSSGHVRAIQQSGGDTGRRPVIRVRQPYRRLQEVPIILVAHEDGSWEPATLVPNTKNPDDAKYGDVQLCGDALRIRASNNPGCAVESVSVMVNDIKVEGHKVRESETAVIVGGNSKLAMGIEVGRNPGEEDTAGTTPVFVTTLAASSTHRRWVADLDATLRRLRPDVGLEPVKWTCQRDAMELARCLANDNALAVVTSVFMDGTDAADAASIEAKDGLARLVLTPEPTLVLGETASCADAAQTGDPARVHRFLDWYVEAYPRTQRLVCAEIQAGCAPVETALARTATRLAPDLFEARSGSGRRLQTGEVEASSFLGVVGDAGETRALRFVCQALRAFAGVAGTDAIVTPYPATSTGAADAFDVDAAGRAVLWFLRWNCPRFAKRVKVANAWAGTAFSTLVAGMVAQARATVDLDAVVRCRSVNEFFRVSAWDGALVKEVLTQPGGKFKRRWPDVFLSLLCAACLDTGCVAITDAHVPVSDDHVGFAAPQGPGAYNAKATVTPHRRKEVLASMVRCTAEPGHKAAGVLPQDLCLVTADEAVATIDGASWSLLWVTPGPHVLNVPKQLMGVYADLVAAYVLRVRTAIRDSDAGTEGLSSGHVARIVALEIAGFGKTPAPVPRGDMNVDRAAAVIMDFLHLMAQLHTVLLTTVATPEYRHPLTRQWRDACFAVSGLVSTGATLMVHPVSAEVAMSTWYDGVLSLLTPTWLGRRSNVWCGPEVMTGATPTTAALALLATVTKGAGADADAPFPTDDVAFDDVRAAVFTDAVFASVPTLLEHTDGFPVPLVAFASVGDRVDHGFATMLCTLDGGYFEVCIKTDRNGKDPIFFHGAACDDQDPDRARLVVSGTTKVSSSKRWFRVDCTREDGGQPSPDTLSGTDKDKLKTAKKANAATHRFMPLVDSIVRNMRLLRRLVCGVRSQFLGAGERVAIPVHLGAHHDDKNRVVVAQDWVMWRSGHGVMWRNAVAETDAQRKALVVDPTLFSAHFLSEGRMFLATTRGGAVSDDKSMVESIVKRADTLWGVFARDGKPDVEKVWKECVGDARYHIQLAAHVPRTWRLNQTDLVSQWAATDIRFRLSGARCAAGTRLYEFAKGMLPHLYKPAIPGDVRERVLRRVESHCVAEP
jgi:hypothetical protein